MCPKYSGVPLHFQCNSHNKEVCHSCAVINHPPTSCILMSKDKLNEMKESEIENIKTKKVWWTQRMVLTENRKSHCNFKKS